MATTKISSDQLIFRSATTGDTLLDTYLENAERGGKTLGQLMTDIFDNSGNFIGATTIDPADFHFRFDPSNPSDLQFRWNGDPIWTTVGTVPTGGGTGDMLKANNLSDLTNVVTAKANLLLGALADASTVTTPLITNAAVTPVKMSLGTANRLLGYNAGGSPSEVTPSTGLSLVGGVLTSAPRIYDFLFTAPADFTPGVAPFGFDISSSPGPGLAKNLFVTMDGIEQYDGYSFTATTVTFTAGCPLLVKNIRIRIII